MFALNKGEPMTFENLNLVPPIQKALKEAGYVTPTPIQLKSIPVILEKRDVLGSAQTGTGKTAAFAVPVLQMLSARQASHQERKIHTLILAPTRELVIQIKDSFVAYGRYLRLRCGAIYGGVSQKPQEAALRAGLDILVATPGRLLDLMSQKLLSLGDIEILVLDEADHMLDMGFIHDVKKIIAAVPQERQTLLFSATMPDEIANLAAAILKNPVRVAVAPVTSTVELTEQSLYFVNKKNKRLLLIHLLREGEAEQTLVFSRTKHGANKITEELVKAGISAEAIHGNKSQSARQSALANFKSGKTRVLVATDIAARGIDVVELPLVINFDLPEVPETYIHRIGRTGRAGQSGRAISFCDQEENDLLRDIEKLTGKKIPVVAEHPYPFVAGEPVAPEDSRHQTPHGRSQGRAGGARSSSSQPGSRRTPGQSGAHGYPSGHGAPRQGHGRDRQHP
jgi:ATP-dependent RNA helicase RhlE